MEQPKKQSLRKLVEESLRKQSQKDGASVTHYDDLLSDYMAFWDTKNKLIRDIKHRGVTYQDRGANGVVMWKSNPSVKELVGVNRQMLAILKDLKISIDGTDGTGGGGTDGKL